MIDEYFDQIKELLNRSSVVRSQDIQFDKRTSTKGYIRGNVYFRDNSMLHFREFVNTSDGIDRVVYAYYYQDKNGVMGFRYDNTPHFRHLPTAPHHKHITEDEVIASSPPDLGIVLGEIESLIDAE